MKFSGKLKWALGLLGTGVFIVRLLTGPNPTIAICSHGTSLNKSKEEKPL